ncbi:MULTISPECIES: M48 family metallopeptidase [Henriciella]|jgi:predicted metal-dependent hydrolase|uniref:M48 family metallopeptidase n=1 Tax=Henriciella TaxID=453849 RepID=UPI003516D0BB
MNTAFELSDLKVEVVRKRIKNVHLSVLPPNGAVRLAAPHRLNDQVLKSFVLSKLSWIRRQQAAMTDQPREPQREFLYLESHYVWGDRYLLDIKTNCRRHDVVLRPKTMTLELWGEYSEKKCHRVLNDWYRGRVQEKLNELFPSWCDRIGASPNQTFVQKMKTRWGGCNPETGNIRINSELAKKPVECLEYILVHELIHLVEPTHNDRFQALMSSHLPTWRSRRDLLNSLPLSHEEWRY